MHEAQQIQAATSLKADVSALFWSKMSARQWDKQRMRQYGRVLQQHDKILYWQPQSILLLQQRDYSKETEGDSQ